MSDEKELGYITIRDDEINKPVEEVRLDIAGKGARKNIVTVDAEPGTYKLVKANLDE